MSLQQIVEAASRDDLFRTGELEVHIDDGLVLAAGKALTLSVREFQLLCALVASGGRIVSRGDLYQHVWGGGLLEGDRSIDVYVRKLRVKLEQALPERRFIHTHVGFGYRFSDEPSHTVHNQPADG